MIIAIAVVLALPAVRAGSRQREVRTTLQHFVGSVRRASSMAVLQRRTVELWISPKESAYAVAVRPRRKPNQAEEAGYDSPELEDGREIVGRVVLPKSASFGRIDGGVYLAREVISIPFYPTGGSGGAKVEFVFDTRGPAQTYVLSISPLLSSIDVEDQK